MHTLRPALPDLKQLADRLGGELSAGGRRALVPGPGHSKRDRSLSLRVSDEGDRILFNSFSGDSARDVFAYLGIDNASEYKPSRKEIDAARRLRDAEARRLLAEKLAFCAGVWEETEPLSDTPGARYLWNRGLVLGCSDIRFARLAPRGVPWNRMAGDPPPPDPHPAVVCLARNGQGEPRGLHLTFVTDDGRKAFGDRSKLMIGPMTGAALRVDTVRHDGVLAVGEGLESSGAFSILRDVPTWPTFSTSGLKGFEVPPNVRHLIIAADNDENGAGLKAAEDLAARVCRRCSVDIEMPRRAGADWNNVLMEGADG
ncbi:MAG: DUF7146 domain-containing protein [Brevundimonas sp.]